MLQAIVFDSKGIIDQNLKKKLESLGISLSIIYLYDEETILSLSVKKPDIIIYFHSAENCNLFDKILETSNNIEIPSIFIVSNPDENFFNKLNNAQSAWYIKEPLDENELYYVAKNVINNYEMKIKVTEDIKEYKAAQKSLEESEQKFRLLAESANDAIWTMDSEGKFLYVSPSVKKLTGFSPKKQ
jgi:PAS domain-containing protein